LRISGLLLALTALTIGVHTHGWVTGLDAAVAKWLVVQRSPGFDLATWTIGEFGRPATAVLLAVICATWLLQRARSVVPAALVIGTVVAATLTKSMLKSLVMRPHSPAELQLVMHHFAPADQHMFPSGHVTGAATLLGMIAVCIGLGRSRTERRLLAGGVVASVLIVAVTLVHVGVHWLSDVIGGALLAALFVALGAEALKYFHDRASRNVSQPGTIRREVVVQ
jgi:membrane-associated phospholipid phosphatase